MWPVQPNAAQGKEREGGPGGEIECPLQRHQGKVEGRRSVEQVGPDDLRRLGNS